MATNFFERQRAARGTTARLVLLFILAILGMVAVINLVILLVLHAQPSGTVVTWMVTATIVTLLLIGGGTLSKTVQLRAGGAAVAQSLGATAIDPTTTDPQLRRFVNIVEEMSLASGVPMPRLFLLESEPGINAFAAGYSPADAAVTVTAGALQQLNRDELQGVIGHEFSHILNGDMRLNIKLIGLLNGILLLALVGSRILLYSNFGGRRNSKDNSANLVLVIALAFVILGAIGQFFASWIKAAVSRQREWLADASSVQFTRNPAGLAGALKRIAGVPDGSTLRNKATATQASHMLFGEGGRSLGSLFATHPPLIERIKALDPNFNPAELQNLEPAESTDAGTQQSGLVGAAVTAPVVPADVASRVGTLTPQDVTRGQELSRQIPAQFRTLAGQPSTAVPLVVAMLVSNDPNARASELQSVSALLGADVVRSANDFADSVATLPQQLLLPLLALAAPTVAMRPQIELDTLQKALQVIAEHDGTVSLFEYCLTRLVSSYIADSADPARRSRPGTAPDKNARAAASTVLAALAVSGQDDPAQVAHAYAAAMSTLNGRPYAEDPRAALTQAASGDWHRLDAAWPVLDGVQPTAKQTMIEAMVAAVRADGVLTLNEAELLRTACALLHCPLPAFVA